MLLLLLLHLFELWHSCKLILSESRLSDVKHLLVLSNLVFQSLSILISDFGCFSFDWAVHSRLRIFLLLITFKLIRIFVLWVIIILIYICHTHRVQYVDLLIVYQHFGRGFLAKCRRCQDRLESSLHNRSQITFRSVLTQSFLLRDDSELVTRW